MITLNMNGLKTQKEEIVRLDGKKIHLYAVYEKHTLDSIQIERKMIKDSKE